jgi:methionyl-tRNA formyltransferase
MIRASGADAIAVAAFGQILPPDVLASARFGAVNIHPSLLPRYRGAAPIQRAILDGVGQTGVTIMQLDEQMDHGPIIAQQTIAILDDDDALSVGNMLAALGADMLLRVLDDAEKSGRIESVAQAHDEATFAPPIAKEDGLVPWSDPSWKIMVRLRAMTPWPGVYSVINGESQITILQAEPLWENEAEELGEAAAEAEPGTVTSLKKDFGFTVRTGDGHLLVTRVKPEGKKPMDGWAYIIGRNIAVGDRLGARKK